MALIFNRQRFYYRSLSRRRKALRLSIICLILSLVAVGIFGYFFWRHHGSDSSPVQAVKPQTSVYEPFLTFTTPYFQFQTDKNWQYEPNESTSNTFVYRGFRGKLVERDLTVYVNALPTPQSLLLTYILPVQAQGNTLISQNISDHCRTVVPAAELAASRNPRIVVVGGVTFTCQVDNSSTIIGTGMIGGSYQTSLTRTDGSQAKYFLLYHDLAYEPNPEIFKAIVDSFRSR